MSDSTMPWFERYFGSDYLRIYRLADTADQLALLRRVLAPWAGGRLLDLPCGHGRHAVSLAADGWRVIGLDLTRVFLGVARVDATNHGIHIGLARADMRLLPVADRAFDAAICMFTSLGYFDSDEQHQAVLDEFARVVRPGGGFVLDLANVDAVRHQAPESSWSKDNVTVHSRYVWDEERHRATTLREAVFTDGRREHYESSVRLFEREEIEPMVAAAGWRIETQWGSYRGDPLSPEQPRRILVCRREG